MEVREPAARALGALPRARRDTRDWLVSTLLDYSPYITSGSRGWARYYAEAGAPFIRITNLSRDTIDLDLSALKFVAVPDGDVEAQRTALQRGDLLVSITADIGIVGCVSERVESPAYINQHIALVRFGEEGPDPRFVTYWLASSSGQAQFRALTDAGAKAGMNLATVANLRVAMPPSRDEQSAIADALRDADALIESLDQLLAKKRQLKQGAMQELLTGKKRLPGFTGQWSERKLGELARIKTGSLNNQDKSEDGEYPFFVRSATVERIDTFTHEGEAILVPGEGGIGSIFHYVNGRFAVHQRVYAINEFAADVSGRFVYQYMSVHFGHHATENSVKATVDSLRLPTFMSFSVLLPPTVEEQVAINEVLSTLDAELEALEARLAKARALKQGMAQALLTGRIRLAPFGG